jgi:hypothetical protein
MPQRNNDEIVRRHAQLRQTLIDKHAKIAAEKIKIKIKIKNLSVGQVARDHR